MSEVLTEPKTGIWVKIAAVLLFIVLGGLIMIVFSPWRPLLDTWQDVVGRVGLAVLLGASFWLAKRSVKLKPLFPVLGALFIMIITVSLMYYAALFLIDNFGLSSANASGFTFLKLSDMVIVFLAVIGPSRLLGYSLSDLYLQKGRVRLGLLIGLGSFAIAAVIAVPSGIWLFKLDPAGLAGWKTWLPWLVIFVLANGAMEELLFRGLFLKKFEPLLGDFLANLTIAVVFTALHFGVGYTSNQFLFMCILIGLALAFGTVVQKTKALWPAILFHAGMDISVMLGIFSNLK